MKLYESAMASAAAFYASLLHDLRAALSTVRGASAAARDARARQLIVLFFVCDRVADNDEGWRQAAADGHRGVLALSAQWEVLYVPEPDDEVRAEVRRGSPSAFFSARDAARLLSDDGKTPLLVDALPALRPIFDAYRDAPLDTRLLAVPTARRD